jgi:hypothetical protein
MRENNDDRDEFNAESYWKRKQVPKVNRFAGEAKPAPADKDCESENYNFKGEGPKSKSPVKESTIWDDESWRDKD